MKKANIIRVLTLVLTLSLAISAFAMPAFAAEIPPVDVEEEETIPASYFETVSAKTAELHAENTDEESETAVPTEIDFIPLYDQTDYDIRYGEYGRISSGGCGLVSVWMVATYMNDEIYDINVLTDQYYDYHVKNAGSKWILIKDSAEAMGIDMVLSDCPHGEWYDWDKVYEALANGQPVICLQKKGIFTGGGHFIVLTGLTEDGKVLVNDPNGANWTKNATMIEGFANGFTPEQIRAGACAYWIYAAKETEPEVVEEIVPVHNLYEQYRPMRHGAMLTMQ